MQDSAFPADPRTRLDTASLLRQVTIFRELPSEVLADLANRVRPRSAEAG